MHPIKFYQLDIYANNFETNLQKLHHGVFLFVEYVKNVIHQQCI